MGRTKILDASSEQAIAEASRVLREGGIVAFPTETFYGLGVIYNDIQALKRLYELKGRPKDKAMPVIIGDRKLLPLVASSINSAEERISKRFWPGPVTLLMPALNDLPDFLTAGTGRVAVRVPGKSFALDLARAIGLPVTATSANTSGLPPADTPRDVIEYFGDGLDLLIDGGKTPGGMPSTIVQASDDGIRILRRGVISDKEILDEVR